MPLEFVGVRDSVGADMPSPNMVIDQEAMQRQFSPDYLNAVTQYAKDGAKLATDIIDTADKALKVAEAAGEGAGTGAVIGAAIPLLGELGIGEAAGAVVGATIAGIYSAFDNFGDDIKEFFNPPDFKESDYDRMKKQCYRIGGIPNWGRPPDNEDGCVFPDGKMSGGDYPRYPPPGVQRIRGDVQLDYDNHPEYFYRPPMKPGPPPLFGDLTRAKINALKSVVQKASAPKPTINLASSSALKSLLSKTTSTKPLLAAGSVRLLLPAPKGTPTMPTIAVQDIAVARQVVRAASQGDATSKAQISDTVNAAKAGDADAQNVASVLTVAELLERRASLTAEYLALKKSQLSSMGALEFLGAYELGALEFTGAWDFTGAWELTGAYDFSGATPKPPKGDCGCHGKRAAVGALSFDDPPNFEEANAPSSNAGPVYNTRRFEFG